MAQVYKAVTKDGCIMAVKVQRPRIQEIIHTDLEIMDHLAFLIEKHIQGDGYAESEASCQ
jgi:Predicted unusual protein kinase